MNDDGYGYGYGYGDGDGDGDGDGMNRVALDPLYERHVAARREELRGLAAHAGTYLLVCSGLLIANLLTSPASLWALWPAFGWSIGVAAHAAGVLGLGGAHGPCHRHNQARLSPQGPCMGDAAPCGTGWRPSDHHADGRDPSRRRLSPRWRYGER